VSVTWFEDTGTGECRLPAWWRVRYRTPAGQWQEVHQASGYPIRKGAPVHVEFVPVTTTALRLDLQLVEGFSAGIYEWEVEEPGEPTSEN
jgi:hypothetical protein